MSVNEISKYLRNKKDEIPDAELLTIIDRVLIHEKNELLNERKEVIKQVLISKLNYIVRKSYKSSELLGFKVKVGDICYVDFGNSYITEAGYQHFGLVIAYFNSKALMIPMSSNSQMYKQSYCQYTFPQGKKHLFRLGAVESLYKESVLFLNDAKFINTARIIEVKSSIPKDGQLFKDILERYLGIVTEHK